MGRSLRGAGGRRRRWGRGTQGAGARRAPGSRPGRLAELRSYLGCFSGWHRPCGHQNGKAARARCRLSRSGRCQRSRYRPTSRLTRRARDLGSPRPRPGDPICGCYCPVLRPARSRCWGLGEARGLLPPGLVGPGPSALDPSTPFPAQAGGALPPIPADRACGPRRGLSPSAMLREPTPSIIPAWVEGPPGRRVPEGRGLGRWAGPLCPRVR